jgi:hypothetical protein
MQLWRANQIFYIAEFEPFASANTNLARISKDEVVGAFENSNIALVKQRQIAVSLPEHAKQYMTYIGTIADPDLVPTGSTVVDTDEFDGILESSDDDVQKALDRIDDYYGSDGIVFFEGNNPPDFVSMDEYGFDDGAAFESGVDQDIVFRIPIRISYQSGLRITLRYCTTTTDTDNVKLLMTYRVKNVGQNIASGTDYQSTKELTPSGNANTIANYSEFTISSGVISSNADFVYCRLQRKGTEDSNDGIFCLFSVTADKI